MKPKFTFFLQTLKEEGRGGGMENEVSSHGSLLCFWCKIYSIYCETSPLSLIMSHEDSKIAAFENV